MKTKYFRVYLRGYFAGTIIQHLCNPISVMGENKIKSSILEAKSNLHEKKGAENIIPLGELALFKEIHQGEEELTEV